MSDKFLISTTGSENNITFDDIGGVTINHPTVDIDLYKEAPKNEVDESLDVQKALDRGAITAKNENGEPIIKVTNTNKHIIQYITDDRLTSTTSNIFRDRLILEYHVDNPGMYKISWYMEYAQSRRGYPIEIDISTDELKISRTIEDNYYGYDLYFRSICGYNIIKLAKTLLEGKIYIKYRSKRGRKAVYLKNLKLILENISY